MSGLSEERRAALTERLEWCRQNASSAPHYSIRDMRDTLEELFAESAALRTERDEAWADALKNNDALGRRVKQCEDLQARLAAPASPDDLARVAGALSREELARVVSGTKPEYWMGDGEWYDAHRRTADRVLAFLLARLTPPTGAQAPEETRMGEERQS